MKQAFKTLTSFLLICFSITTAMGDTAGLSLQKFISTSTIGVPAMCDNIISVESKDTGRIKLALQARLNELFGMEEADLAKLNSLPRIVSQREGSVYHPAEIQFFFREARVVEDGICVMCRVKDSGGERTYFAVFFTQTR